MQDRAGGRPEAGAGKRPETTDPDPTVPELNEDERDRGREAWRPSQIHPPGWRDIWLRVSRRIGRELVPLVAAGVAFCGMLALFPAIAMLVSLAGLFFDPVLVVDQLDMLDGLAPAEPLAVVRDQAVELVDQAPAQATATAVFSFLLSLFWASRGIDNLVSGINMAHAEEEERNLVMRNIVSLGLTTALTAMVLAALALAVVAPSVARALGPADWAGPLASIGRWLVLGLLSLSALGLLYRYAPSRRPPRWSWVTPGAVIATALWLGSSVLFALFVRSFGSYQLIYGALAGVVILLLYIWITAFVVLLGALLNAEMEHQSRRDTTRGRVRPMGERDAEVADTLGRKP